MIDVEQYGPWAVIVGGSEGVGAEFALHLARAGFNLVLFARKPGPLEEVASRGRELGVEVRTAEVDLLEPKSYELIRESTAGLEVGLFIYNAGSNTYRSEFVDSDPEGVQGVLDLNIMALLPLLRHFGHRLKQQKRGGIIVTGSENSYVGTPRIATYAASKAFLRIFIEGLWLELKPFGVDVLELSLGLTRTPAMERLGMRFDNPELQASDPQVVAREGLENIKAGPSWIADGRYESARQKSGFPRADIVKTNFEIYLAMSGGSPSE